MTQKITIAFLSVLILAFVSYYYFFLDTLSVSELAGKSADPGVTLFVNVFDFDTGLTRWDVHNLKKKITVLATKD